MPHFVFMSQADSLNYIVLPMIALDKRPVLRRKSNLCEIYVPVRRGTAVGFCGSSHKVLWSSSYMVFCFSEGSS